MTERQKKTEYSDQNRKLRLQQDALYPDLDPRVIATRAEMNYRHSFEGHTETVVRSTYVTRGMALGQKYLV